MVEQNVVASQVVHLQNRGIIMYMVDFYPSRDQFEEWIHEVIGRRMRIAIEQIKVLAKYTFLLVVSKPEEQHAILLKPYWYMSRKMVLTQPWTPDIDAKETRTAKALVWIDMPRPTQSCL